MNDKIKNIIKKTVPIRFLIYIAVPILFVILPVETAEQGSLCFWYVLSGVLCPGCGTTRAMTNFMHLDFIRAFSYNPFLTCFIAPVFFIFAVNDIWIFFRRLANKTDKLSLIEFCIFMLFGNTKIN